jgi:hypothetical protein
MHSFRTGQYIRTWDMGHHWTVHGTPVKAGGGNRDASQVLRLCPGFPYKVLSVSIKPEILWRVYLNDEVFRVLHHGIRGPADIAFP